MSLLLGCQRKRPLRKLASARQSRVVGSETEMKKTLPVVLFAFSAFVLLGGAAPALAQRGGHGGGGGGFHGGGGGFHGGGG